MTCVLNIDWRFGFWLVQYQSHVLHSSLSPCCGTKQMEPLPLLDQCHKILQVIVYAGSWRWILFSRYVRREDGIQEVKK